MLNLEGQLQCWHLRAGVVALVAGIVLFEVGTGLVPFFGFFFAAAFEELEGLDA